MKKFGGFFSLPPFAQQQSKNHNTNSFGAV
jgi:hypothetical protein